MATQTDDRPAGLAAIMGRRSADEVVEVGRLQAALIEGLFGRAPDPVRVGRYTIIRRLGAGGFGVVYEGYDPQLDRRVALKLLRSSHAREATIHEARAMARVRHPCVVTIHDVGETDDVASGRADPFIVMELIEGMHLGRWAATEPRPPWQRSVAVLSAAARGLAAVHAHGLVHRDFKPENVLVGDDGRVCVSDFGVAMQASAIGSVPAGTWSYMAPEQLAGGSADARSDLYSFCVVAFELLHGRRPYPAETREELARRQREPVPTFVGGPVPRAIDVALARGLTPAPAERWPDMPSLCRALESAAAAPGRRRRRLIAGVAAVGIAATMLAVGRRRTDPCATDPQSVAATWGAEQRASLETRLESTSGGRYVLGQLDRYAAAWQSASIEACRSTRIDAVRSEADLQVAQECLDGHLVVVAAVVALLRESAASPSSLSAVALLEPPSTCLQAPGATLPPADLDLLRGATRAEVLRTTGDLSGAIDLADDVLRLAMVADDPGTQARALLTKGRAERELDRAEAAAQDLTEAARIAALRGDAPMAIRAKTWLALVLDHDLDRTEEADRLLVWLAAEVNQRADVDLVAGELSFVTGEIRRRQGRYGDAEIAFRRALEHYEAQLGPEHPRLTSVLHGVGVSRCEGGADPGGEPWLERALAIVEATYGPEHPSAGVQHNALGACALRDDDFDEAAREFQLAHAIFAEALGETNGRTIGVKANLAAAWSSAGENDRALAAFADVLRAMEARHGTAHRNVAGAAMNLGHALLNDARAAAALPHLERAARWSDTQPEPHQPNDGRAFRLYAQALLELGRLGDAQEWFSRALAIEASLDVARAQRLH